jgi:NTE family protein
MALHALNVLTAHQLAGDARRYGGQAEVIVVPPLCPLARPAYDFTSARELIDRATESTGAWLESGGLNVAPDWPTLAPHHHESSPSIPTTLRWSPS